MQTVFLFQHSSRKSRRAELRAFWREIASTVGQGRGMTCLVTTDAELRRLNREFRKKDYSTDVLSFPSSGADAGEIAISWDRAETQATEMKHSVDDELRVLMLHGALHLIGMDHETDAGEMGRAEARWRKKFGLPVGLIGRVRA